MKLITKKKFYNGWRLFLMFGIPVFAYYRGNGRFVSIRGRVNVVENRPPKCKVMVFGNRNKIVFPARTRCEGFLGTIQVGAADCSVEDSEVTIGNDIQANGLSIIIMENGTRITIGNDCLISSGVQLWASDTHSMLDVDGNVVNRGRHITVGNHVWIGVNALVMKNVVIPDNCVVGAGAVVSGRLDVRSGSVIAGNPARLVKTGIMWSKSRPGALLKGGLS